MDVMVLNSTNFVDGELINGLKTIKWVERFREPGEFELTSEPTDFIRNKLPLGSLISHTNSRDVMMVEDHEIDETGETPVFKITGRSIIAFLENRIASGNNFSIKNQLTDKINPYDFLARTTIDNLMVLLNDQLTAGAISASDIIPTLQIQAAFTGTDTPKEMIIPRGELYPQVISLLESMDAGIKVIRPIGTSRGIPLVFLIHKGNDLSGTAMFSSDYGDLGDTKYFWTNRKYKNSALVVGQYSSKVIRLAGATGMNMRVMYVEAPDYDFKPVSSAELTTADNILTRRGEAALAANKTQQYLETSILPTARLRFRTDYDIGDIVYVKGNYGVAQKMRVIEFAEFEDETGQTGIPTVKAL